MELLVEVNLCFWYLCSSFVETYLKQKEKGVEYSGFKKKIGFKLHQIIDHHTRLSLRETVTGGARSDIVLLKSLIKGSPPNWLVKVLVADKGYDGTDFVAKIYHYWKEVQIAIPLRKTNQETVGAKRRETTLNQALKGAESTFDSQLLNRRNEIERYFSRKKRVFYLGEERTRGLKNFRANCYLTSIMKILEWLITPSLLWQFFTKLL